MAFKQIRKIIRYGKSSNGVVLPKEWLDYYGLCRGDEIVILGNHMLIIAPKQYEQRARELIERRAPKRMKIWLFRESNTPEVSPS